MATAVEGEGPPGLLNPPLLLLLDIVALSKTLFLAIVHCVGNDALPKVGPVETLSMVCQLDEFVVVYIT